MDRIEKLRNLLHRAMDCGNYDEILKISQTLDIEIVNHIRNSQKDAKESNESPKNDKEK